MLTSDTQFIDGLLKLTQISINVMQMCRVVSISGSKADVQPLARKSNGTKRAMVQGALVLAHCQDDIAVGKVVAVVFCDRDLDNIRGSEDYTLSTSRMHSVNDAVVMGVWNE